MKTVISEDGTKIAYDTYGDGPALIYITGAICFRNFMPVVSDAKAFAKEFTVYNYDRRGRGHSGDTQSWSIEREVEDIAALIEAAGGSAYIYGHSSGAVLALEAAVRLGNKVKKAVIYDASYVHDAAEATEYAKTSQKVEHLLSTGENGRAIKTFLLDIGMPRPFVFLLPLFPGWATMKDLAPTLMYDITLTENTPPLERFSDIVTPIYVMVGQKSPSGLHDVAEQLREAIPGAAFKMIQGQDHMVSSKILLPELVGFLK